MQLFNLLRNTGPPEQKALRVCKLPILSPFPPKSGICAQWGRTTMLIHWETKVHLISAPASQ